LNLVFRAYSVNLGENLAINPKAVYDKNHFVEVFFLISMKSQHEKITPTAQNLPFTPRNIRGENT
jgi:hypothetical protein